MHDQLAVECLRKLADRQQDSGFTQQNKATIQPLLLREPGQRHVCLSVPLGPCRRTDEIEDLAANLLRFLARNAYLILNPLGRELGWARGDVKKLFTALDAGGRCAVSALVRVEDGKLYPSGPLKLFMITNNAAIAQSDCLLYAVADDGTTVCS